MAKKLSKKPMPEVKPEEVEKEKIKKTKVRVIGIGGGGGNIVSELAQRVKRATFLAANTDLKALKEVSRKVERFSFGQSLTHGLGTGMNSELGEMAAQKEKERIKKILQGQDLVILITSLGGGVGSGAIPVFAQISKNLGNLTYGIFTLPFKFEGEKKMEIARRALESLRPKLNTITIIPNERIFQIIDKTTPLKDAFSAINKSLAQSLEGLIETIYQPGLINIDFADLRTILEGQGRMAYLNTLSLPRKEGTAKEAAEKALASPLYPYGIKGAKGVLFNIAGGKGLSLEEVSQISKTISEKVNPEAKIIFGISPGGKYQNIIKTTIFATGLSTKIFSNGAKKPFKPKRRKKISKVDAEVKPRQKEKPVSKVDAEVKPLPKVKKPSTRAELGAGLVPHRPASEIGGGAGAGIKKVTPTPKIGGGAKKPEKKLLPSPEVEAKKEKPPTSEGGVGIKVLDPSAGRTRVRKNALQLKKETEEAEKEMLEKEKFWETPAFLRKKLIKGQ